MSEQPKPTVVITAVINMESNAIHLGVLGAEVDPVTLRALLEAVKEHVHRMEVEAMLNAKESTP